MLDGRKYNRAIRLHKLMYEALMRLAWAGFEAWLGENEKDNITQALTIVKDFVEDISGDKLQELLQVARTPTGKEIFCFILPPSGL